MPNIYIINAITATIIIIKKTKCNVLHQDIDIILFSLEVLKITSESRAR